MLPVDVSDLLLIPSLLLVLLKLKLVNTCSRHVESFVEALPEDLIDIVERVVSDHRHIAALELAAHLRVDVELACLQQPLALDGLVKDSDEVALDGEDLCEQSLALGAATVRPRSELLLVAKADGQIVVV